MRDASRTRRRRRGRWPPDRSEAKGGSRARDSPEARRRAGARRAAWICVVVRASERVGLFLKLPLTSVNRPRRPLPPRDGGEYFLNLGLQLFFRETSRTGTDDYPTTAIRS